MDVHSAQALLKCFLSDINNIKDSSILRKAKLGRTLPFDECGVYLNFKMIWMTSFNKEYENFNNFIVLLP